MTLVGRLLLFFLATLALVLVGFSVTLFVLARNHLYRQLDDCLNTTLNTLTAAAEIHPLGVEWDVRQRLLRLEPGDMAVSWVVRDGAGNKVDGSQGASLGSILDALSDKGGNSKESTGAKALGDRAGDVNWHDEAWRVQQRRLQGGGKDSPFTQPDDNPSKTYPELVFSVAAPTAPIRASLQALAWMLTTLAVGLWLAAALVGRRLCRRALLPLTRMAATARTISATALDRRLADTGTRDELADLGKAFNDLLANLQESFERQRRFTGDAAHQLRTPLTALIGQIDVALRRERPIEEYQRVLTLLQNQSAHLRHIVEMLLFLARADAEAMLPQTESIDLTSWLRDYLQSRSEQPPCQNIRLDVAGNGGLTVRAQVPLLGQLLDNLLDNARKYSSAGTPITIKTWRESEFVYIAVEDQGCGIPAADLPRVFEPFYRSPAARRDGVSGVGLGLAVAKRIAEAFHGRLDVASVLGRASCFTLRLPAGQD
jgi:two-component system, OmpR family, sensor kinase